MSAQCGTLPPQAPHLAAGWAEKERAGGPWLEALPSPGLRVTLWQLHFLSPTDRPEEQTEHAFINILTRGDLSSIRWVCSPLRHAQPTGPGVQLCTIYYASLNFRDIMLATGKLSPDAIPGIQAAHGGGTRTKTLGARTWEEGVLTPQCSGTWEAPRAQAHTLGSSWGGEGLTHHLPPGKWVARDCMLGMEFSGRDARGKRVMGLVPAEGLATSILVSQDFLWDVPSNW